MSVFCDEAFFALPECVFIQAVLFQLCIKYSIDSILIIKKEYLCRVFLCKKQKVFVYEGVF